MLGWNFKALTQGGQAAQMSVAAQLCASILNRPQKLQPIHCSLLMEEWTARKNIKRGQTKRSERPTGPRTSWNGSDGSASFGAGLNCCVSDPNPTTQTTRNSIPRALTLGRHLRFQPREVHRRPRRSVQPAFVAIRQIGKTLLDEWISVLRNLLDPLKALANKIVLVHIYRCIQNAKTPFQEFCHCFPAGKVPFDAKVQNNFVIGTRSELVA
jgi:hypothetical protein